MNSSGVNDLYKAFCGKILKGDSECLNQVIEIIMTKIGMEYGDFTQSLIHHMQDKAKVADISAIKEKAQEGTLVLPGEEAPPLDFDTTNLPAVLTDKKKLKQAHKDLHAMALEHMLTLKLQKC